MKIAGLHRRAGPREAARCLNCGICSECMQCVAVCQAGAVDHEQTDRKPWTLEVGSVILAPGFKTFDPSGIDTYGYGKHPNVITSLEFERILSPGGPFHGHVMRRSDGKEPKKIAWIHCVGHARATGKANTRIAPISAAWPALKQAVIAREHIGAGSGYGPVLHGYAHPPEGF